MNEKKNERRLREIIAKLPAERVAQLLDFAEFLLARYPARQESAQMQVIERPQKESVIKAIQRLSATYPMLDRGRMLNETSALMSQHVIQGRDAVEVIDELEVLFRRHYQTFIEREK